MQFALQRDSPASGAGGVPNDIADVDLDLLLRVLDFLFATSFRIEIADAPTKAQCNQILEPHIPGGRTVHMNLAGHGGAACV